MFSTVVLNLLQRRGWRTHLCPILVQCTLSSETSQRALVAPFMNSGALSGSDSNGYSCQRDTHQEARWAGHIVPAASFAEFVHILEGPLVAPRR